MAWASTISRWSSASPAKAHSAQYRGTHEHTNLLPVEIRHQSDLLQHSRFTATLTLVPYQSKVLMSSYRQKSSRACPCSDLNAVRIFLVHFDTCSLGRLDSGRHLSRRLFGTCFSALVPCTCLIPRPTLPSTTLGTRHLSGTSIKSPLYVIYIVRLLYCGWASRLNQ